MVRNTVLKLRLLFVSLALVVLMAACAGGDSTVRVWTEAPGWSRAQKVGNTATIDPASIALDGDGNIYLVVVDGEGEEDQVGVIALDRQAEINWHLVIEEQSRHIDDTSIVWDGDSLRLFWIGDNSLYATDISPLGELTGGIQLLSADIQVQSFDVTKTRNGDLSLWFAGPRRNPGIYALLFDGHSAASETIDLEGIHPSLKYDRNGNLHASWVQHPPGSTNVDIFYGYFDGAAFSNANVREITTARVAVTSVFTGPILELDGNNVYLYWSEEVRTGSGAGIARTQYISFPLAQPAQASNPIQIYVPSEHSLDLDYLPEGGLMAGPRYIVPQGSFSGATGISWISPNPTLADEGVIVSQSRVDYLFSKTAPQIGLNYFQSGANNGYQPISFTSTVSSSPAIISDQQDYLYITWLERVGNDFDVYFASTAPDLKDNLKNLTWDDTWRLVGETSFGLLIGALLTPIALVVWLLVPLALLLLSSPLRRGEQSLRSFGTLFSLLIVISVYMAEKYFTIPNIRDYVPFSAWLPISTWLQGPLQIFFPILITTIALVAAWHFTYRRENNQPLYFVILFGAVDSLMTMAVYGLNILNAF